nr:crustin 2 [Palaemon carinicauda]
MIRLCFLAVGILFAVAQAQVIGGHLGTCPPPKQQVQQCKNFCKLELPGTSGQYYCCDQQLAPHGHQGSCPTVSLLPNEIEVMCDPNDSNRPYSLNCKSDDDCFEWEKCCYTPLTQQRICRIAIYN